MSKINDRSNHNGDCYIVTGSIGPAFEPKLFRKHTSAVKYAKEILKDGKHHQITPPYKPVIEDRYESDMLGRMKIIEG